MHGKISRTLNRLGNHKQVDAIKEVGWHADGGGLYLRVLPNGTRRWVMVDQTGGKRKERGIGVFPDVSVAKARDERNAVPEEPKVAPSDVTFGAFADELLPTILPGFKNAKHRQQWKNTLATHAKGLRPKPIQSITTNDVLEVLSPIWQTVPETAKRLRGRIERILGAAKASGLRPIDSINPAAWDDHLEHFLKVKKKRVKRHAAMPWQELPAFWTRLGKMRSTTAKALQITILGWTRTNETIGATRSELDLEAKLWTIPAERMKAGIEHVIPLTDSMVAIFKEMIVGLEPHERIFPLSDMAMLMSMRKMKLPYTVHGFRSAARDWAGDETDHPREIAEMALSHAVGDAVEQAYRRGTALAKRRKLMEDWEKFLLGGKPA